MLSVAACPTAPATAAAGKATAPDKFFVASHDREAESRGLRERFGTVATFFTCRENDVSRVDERRSARPAGGRSNTPR